MNYIEYQIKTFIKAHALKDTAFCVPGIEHIARRGLTLCEKVGVFAWPVRMTMHHDTCVRRLKGGVHGDFIDIHNIRSRRRRMGATSGACGYR